MNPFVQKIKPQVRSLVPYTLRHFEARVKINQNENPFDTPEPIKESLLRTLRERPWARYPEFVPEALLKKLSAFVHWPKDGLMVGNGSNEILKTIFFAIAEPGKRVVAVQPTFAVYKQLANITGARYQEVPLTRELTFDVEAIERAVVDADLTVLCVPNNPTGTPLSPSALDRILRSTPGLVAVDEAYHEFSGQTAVDRLPQFQNLIVLRTFSKAMALAGMRIGYMLADPEITVEIAKAKLPYNVNFASLAAAEAALAHMDLLRANVERIIVLRESLQEQLSKIDGVEAFSSAANFILFRTPLPASELFDRLYAQSILVRDVSKHPLLERCLRVSVGTEDENGMFLEALRKALGEDL